MPSYHALLWYDHADITIRISLVARSDAEALRRLPPIDPGIVIELSHGERLVAVRTARSTVRASDARAELDTLFARLLEPDR